MEFDFLIRDTIKKAWEIYKRNFWFFTALALVSVIFNLTVSPKYWYVGVVSVAASLVWSFVWIKAALAAADGHEDNFQIKNISQFFPTWRQLVYFFVTGILVEVSIAAGLILLIIPGIYLAIRLSFASFAFYDKNLGPVEAYKYSWNMTRGKVFWTVFSTGLAVVGLAIVGIIALGVGIVVAYPIILILTARLYRELSNHYEKTLIPNKEA